MSLQKITPRIWMLPGDSYTDRPNLYYILGDERSMAVDAGASPAHVQAFYRAIEEYGFPLPRLTVITHWHWDHTFGLCAAVGETLATEATCAQLKTMQQWAWNRSAMQQRELAGQDISFCNMCIMREYAADPSQIRVVVPQRAVTHPETLDLGGITARLLPVPSPHSEDQLSVYIPEEKTLLVGDGNCDDVYNHQGMYEEESLQRWIGFLESIDHVHHLEGHGDPLTKEENLAELRGQVAHCRRYADQRGLVRAYKDGYVHKMRQQVGHAPLLMTGVAVLLTNSRGELLLLKRRDNGCWAPPGGGVEIGETVENAARRETWEETGVVPADLSLFGVYTGEGRFFYYPNGDVCCYTQVVFRCRDYVGQPMQTTDEAMEHGFFAPDALPDNLNPCDAECIRDWARGVSGIVCN